MLLCNQSRLPCFTTSIDRNRLHFHAANLYYHQRCLVRTFVTPFKIRKDVLSGGYVQRFTNLLREPKLSSIQLTGDFEERLLERIRAPPNPITKPCLIAHGPKVLQSQCRIPGYMSVFLP